MAEKPFPCDICGENIVPGSRVPSEGEYAEFFDPSRPWNESTNSVVAHAECGMGAGMQLA